ncbi:MAG: PilW family protein [Proteobacteria bacterium]|nr:PilW family protein [Pseudomonadota bacterium]
MISGNRILGNRGFTIVELMISLAIGMVLILGATSFLATTDRSNRLQTAVSGLNISGRFGLDRLARDIRMSGYRDSNWALGPLNNVISATDGPAANGGDSITLFYEGARDCAFALVPGGIVSNTYQVVNGNLECNGQAVTGGVQEMQIYLGEDTDSDGVANRWMSPGAAGLDMTRLVSVRVHLLVRTDGNNVSSGAQGYYFNNAQQAAIGDGQIRREYSVTIAMRNPT